MIKNSFNISHCGISDPGLLRSHNEDYWSVILDGRGFILSDGMGGHRAGEVAAHYAVSHLGEQLELFSQVEDQSLESLSKLMRRALSLTNQYVWQRALSRLDWKGMGATLTALFFHEREAIYGHVGDSALFLFREGILKQLSEEHTKRVESEGRHRTVLTRAIGVHAHVQSQVGSIEIQKGDRFLLCSDGITCYLSKDELKQVLSIALDLRSGVETLFSIAMQRGGGDNITAILVEVGNELL